MTGVWVPACEVRLRGAPLAPAHRAALLRVEVDLDLELFGRAVLDFHDEGLRLLDEARFGAGDAVEIRLGFAGRLAPVFSGEVVELAPEFRRDQPLRLRVVCLDPLHRLVLSAMTRALNDVDDRQIATQVAQAQGLSAEAPSGTREHAFQAGVSDAVFLRRLARRQGNHLRLAGSKLVLGPPADEESEVVLRPSEGVSKLRLRERAGGQVGAVSVHGWDPRGRREIVGRATPEGEAGAGARAHGGGSVLSIAGHEPAPGDTATAEAMARGRLRRLAEQFVTLEVEMVGEPRLQPGALFTLDEAVERVEGKYRVERARHRFDKHGYRLSLRAARVRKKAPAPPPRVAPPEPSLANPRWGAPQYQHGDAAELLVDARNCAGRTVHFLVEEEGCGGQWVPFARATASARADLATGFVDLRHPALAEGAGARTCARAASANRRFRFLAWLAGRPPVATAPAAPAAGPPDDARLENLRWGAGAAGHGDEVELIAEAHGLDGQRVFFTLEHDRGGGDWAPLQTAEAQVRACHAVARARLQHPVVGARVHRGPPAAEPARVGGPRQLRFRASFSAPGGAAPPRAPRPG